MTGHLYAPVSLRHASEDILIRRVQEAEAIVADEAFDELRRRHAHKITHFASALNSSELSLLGLGRDDAEQEMRLAFWDAIRRFDPNRGWRLTTYAEHRLNGALIRLRRKAKRHADDEAETHRVSPSRLLSGRLPLAEDDSLAIDWPDREPSPEAAVVSRESRPHARRAVRDFVRGLSPSLRRVAVCRHWHDLSPAETARHLSVSRAAISQSEKRIAQAAQSQIHLLVEG